MNDTILGAAVGATLTLTILECGFWGFVVWIILKDKRNSKVAPYVGDEDE